MEDFTGLGKVANASASVINNVLNKISSATGVLYNDSDYKIRKEAQKKYIASITSNPDIDESIKASLISNHKQIFKHCRNQEKITEIALFNLKEEPQTDKVSDDWLLYFYDNAKNISDENIQFVWGNILASELNKAGSVPKSLIHTLSIIGAKDAEMFNELCRYVVRIEGGYYPLILKGFDDYFNSVGLEYSQLLEFEKLGLINFNPITGYALEGEKAENHEGLTFDLTVLNKIITVETINKAQNGKILLSIGTVLFTKDGETLCVAINRIQSEKIIEMIVEYYGNGPNHEVIGTIEKVVSTQ